MTAVSQSATARSSCSETRVTSHGTRPSHRTCPRPSNRVKPCRRASTLNAGPIVIRSAQGSVEAVRGLSFDVNRGETVAQTAVRETREETGLHVEVGSHVASWKNNRVHLFLCTPAQPIADYAALTPLDTGEVSRVIVLNPRTMRDHDGTPVTNGWRFEETRMLLRALYPAPP